MSQTTKRHLLVVEDELEIQEVLSESLEDLNLKITCADHGKQAIELLKANPDIHAVLSDIRMPEMSGIDLLCRLRFFTLPPPLIFLTAYHDKDYLLEGLRLGAFDFLEKPFKQERLVEVVDRALEVGVKLQELRELQSVLKDPDFQHDPAFFEKMERYQRLLSFFQIKNQIRSSAS